MGYEHLSQEGFIDEFKEVSNGTHPSKFCFILGAGASKSSGIKTGQELVDIWEKELIKRSKSEYLKWKEKLGITEENKYSFYSQYYEKRYKKRPIDGLNYLEKIMEDVNPGVGYIVLSYLLTSTIHNVVITTNFDHLTEDAINYYTHKIPLIIGHESLAHYISKQITRPTIIKIHRDLLFDPKNTSAEIEELHELWKESLELIFEEYHPIFIGYAGNDNSLMNYLISNKEKFKSGEWKFPYWMLYKSNTPDGKVKEFLEASEGYCIKYNGFDELLCLIGKESGYKMPKEEEFLKDAKLRYKKLSEDFENILINKTMKDYKDSEDDESLAKAIQSITDDTDSIAKYTKAVLLHNQGKYKEALQLKRELIENYPRSARYHDSLGVTLHEMKRYDEALKEKEKAVELESENARYHNSLGITLHEMKRYEEALKEEEKAVELEPENAKYHDELGTTLHEMERYEEALKETEKAVELEPENAKYHNNLGIALHEMKRYKEALKETEKAVELEPKNIDYRKNLEIMKTI